MGVFWSQAPVILRPRQKLPHSDSGVPSPPAVRSYCPIATGKPAGTFAPTPGHLCISEYGGDSEQREKSRDQGEWRVREGSGNTGTQREEMRGIGNMSAPLVFLGGAGPGDRIRRCNRAAGRRGQVPGCPARLPQLRPLRPHFCNVGLYTSQRRLLRCAVALALYTLLKIACETSFQSAQAEFELHQ